VTYDFMWFISGQENDKIQIIQSRLHDSTECDIDTAKNDDDVSGCKEAMTRVKNKEAARSEEAKQSRRSAGRITSQ